jgi:NAD dependent epimerase/dehydratase
MKILVTGAEGFIGSHLVELLLKKKFKVKALVLYNSFNSWGWLENLNSKLKNNLEVVLGDIRDKENFEDLSKSVDIIINMAALIGIPYSYKASRSYIETNVIGSLNVLNSALKNNISQVIQISTSEVYGTPKKVPITENFPYNAQSPYAASKIAADQLSLSFYRSFNLPVSIIRPFNTYGPRQSARAIIPTIITQALKNKKIKLGSVYPKRDLMYVEDTVRGICAAINNKKTYGQVINLGTGYEISIKNLVEKISKLLGFKIEYQTQTNRKRPKKSEVDRLLASNKKAKKLLNWKPKYSKAKGLDDGLRQTLNWFKEEKNLKLYKYSDFNY